MPELEDDDEQPLGVNANNPGEDPDRLSFGQRIAGMGGPAPIAQPSAPPADATPPPAPKQDLDMSKMPDVVKALTGPDSIPTPPTGASNPNLVDLSKKQAALSTPINPVDTATGKTKPQYRMGLGTRILGSLANAAAGFSGRGGEPVYVGPGATNQRYAREERQRQGDLAGINTQIGTQEKLDTENERMYRDAIRQAYESQVGEARKQTSAAQMENAETKKALETSQADLNEARKGKLGQVPEPKTEPEIALALQDAKLKNDKQAITKYQGALDELKRLKIAGRDTSAADVTKAIQVAEFRLKQHGDVDKQQEEERQKRYAEIDKNLKVIGTFNADKNAAEKAKVDADLQTKYSPKHQDIDSQADKMLGLTKSGGPLKSGADLKGKPLSIDEAKDYLKRAGGNKDKARKLAKQDGRTF